MGKVLVTVVVCPVVQYDIHRRGSPYGVRTEEGVSAPPNFPPCQSNLFTLGLCSMWFPINPGKLTLF